MVKQLNIFIENRPGRLKAVTDVLSQAGLNIWAFTIQDRGDFGLMKLIVDKPGQAQMALSEKAFACALKDVWAIAIPDKPGNLHKLTGLLLEAGVNILDAHGVGIASTKEGLCFLELSAKDARALKSALEGTGFKVLEERDIYAL